MAGSIICQSSILSWSFWAFNSTFTASVDLKKKKKGRKLQQEYGEQFSCTNILSGSQFSSVQFSCSVLSNSLRPHEPQHTRPPCPSPTPGVHPNPCQLSWWCHPTISSSVIPFFSCPQSFPASGWITVGALYLFLIFRSYILLNVIHRFSKNCICRSKGQ